jgi:adenine deaminase
MNDCVRLAVAAGVRLEDALVLATSNPADYHRFDRLGRLAPGYQADILCFDDISTFVPARVWQAGRLVAMNGKVVPGAVPVADVPEWMLHSVHLEVPPGPEAFELSVPQGGRARVIGVESRSLSTRNLVIDVNDVTQGVARIGVVERHRHTGRVGLGYVKGFGLLRGAMASTVAHDAHNCMVVGALDASGPSEMAVAVARLAEIGGGQVAVLNGRVVSEVRLPIGGLMSQRPAAEVADEARRLGEAASNILGVTIDEPFMQLSFLGLSVIPELRITDRGLVDVSAFALTNVADV